MLKKRKIIVAITGASGSVYGKKLLENLMIFKNQIYEVAVVFSDKGKEVWKFEIGKLPVFEKPFKLYNSNDFFAPFASGSAGFDTMIICPCSMGTLGRIANGISDNLITRAADVMLKEKGKLLLVLREAPYSLIHINNMKIVTEAGAIIYPANPSFYGKPETMDDLIATVIDRILFLAGFDTDKFTWGEY